MSARNNRKTKRPPDLPKAGPGQVFVLEGTKEPHYRNIGEHPLTLAFHRGKLGPPKDETTRFRFAAGETFRIAFEQMAKSGRNFLDMDVGGGGSATPWSDSQADAIRFVGSCKVRMYRPNFVIVVRFCGEAHHMPEAVRLAGLAVHPDGIAFRVREAMDELVSVVGGRLAVSVMEL